MIEQATQIQENLQRVQGRIVRAAQSAGRDPESVQLVVVTKFQPLDVVHAAIVAGHRFWGRTTPKKAPARSPTWGERQACSGI